MSRYVILEHDYPELHWDFMLEVGGSLRTWRLAFVPSLDESIAATPLGDHRIAYLDYEGPVSGNRGTVNRWDQGEYEMIEEADCRMVVRLNGERLRGIVTLIVQLC